VAIVITDAEKKSSLSVKNNFQLPELSVYWPDNDDERPHQRL
jgi:hypothetical protein